MAMGKWVTEGKAAIAKNESLEKRQRATTDEADTEEHFLRACQAQLTGQTKRIPWVEWDARLVPGARERALIRRREI
jgi:hypothetical protein